MVERKEAGRSRGSGGGGAAEWERWLPRSPVRVLVVEEDDSTRQIITALLRKCSYQVAVASDGLKAWEILKEGAHNIDLVLTEVQLPLVSGFVLLTMIMEHEPCRHIPVIMMSSHDSISMVFKCMLKGAADFLVKPIRKNELGNLWQHVWRRHSSTGGHCSLYCNKNLANRRSEANADNNAIDHASEYVACLQKSKISEKASDAQSSCTRSDMEAESTFMQNLHELSKQRSMDFSLIDNGIAQNAVEHIQSGTEFVVLEDDEEDDSSILGSARTPCNEVCHSNELIPEVNVGVFNSTVNKEAMPKAHVDYNGIATAASGQTDDQKIHSKETIDLIGSMYSDPRCNHELRDNTTLRNDFLSPSEFLILENAAQLKSISSPFLELSLRMHYCNSSDKKTSDDWNTLNRANSSAFSLYTRKTVPSISSTTRNTTTSYKQDLTTVKPLFNQYSGNGSSTPQCDDAAPHTNGEDARLLVALTSQDGMTIQPSRIIPFPVSGMWQVNGQPMYYPPSGNSLWSTPTMWQDAVQPSSSCQTDLEKLVTVQNNHPDGQTAKSSHNNHSQRQEENVDVVDEQRRAISATGESENINISNAKRSNPNSNGFGSFCFAGDGNITGPNISKLPTEIGNGKNVLASEGFKPTNSHLLNQREAALTKFRLKRKDRCYEKKVRYQSRKRLAEQRPRVKGQFVRHVHLGDSTNG